MAKRGNMRTVISGSILSVWDTFSFTTEGKLSSQVATNLMESFDFGKGVLILRSADGKVWRNRVVFGETKKVLTVQLVFEVSNDWTDELKQACQDDAESVLESIASVLADNEVTGNDEPVKKPESSSSKAEDTPDADGRHYRRKGDKKPGDNNKKGGNQNKGGGN